MITLEVQSDLPQAVRNIQRFATRQHPAERMELMKEFVVLFTNRVLERTPVDTGRARAAWMNAIEQLAGTASPGWREDADNPAAIAEGKTDGSAHIEQTTHATQIEITNNVPYISILEDGSSSQPATEMVSETLAEAGSILQSLLQTGGRP